MEADEEHVELEQYHVKVQEIKPKKKKTQF